MGILVIGILILSFNFKKALVSSLITLSFFLNQETRA